MANKHMKRCSTSLIIQFSQFSSVAQSCLTLCDPMNCSTPGFPLHHQLPEFTQTQTQFIESVMPSSHLILSLPLLLLPPIPPSITVFSNESTLRMRWPKYWSFTFSISPSKEYPGLISFRMDWLDLLAVQGLSRVFSNNTVQKYIHMVLEMQRNQGSNCQHPMDHQKSKRILEKYLFLLY